MPEDHKQHRQRLKNRFLREGLDHFERHNILELLLFYAIPQGDTNPLAHRLIDHFGSISAVFDASYEELLKVKGVGEHTAILLKLCLGITKAYLDDGNSPGVTLDSPNELCKYIVPKFAGETNEILYIICLDSRKRVLYCGKIQEGTINQVSLSGRKVAEKALSVNARFVVLAHNHPGSYAVPSSEDVRATEKMLLILRGIGIELMDHIIVAENDAVSMRESGLINTSTLWRGYKS